MDSETAKILIAAAVGLATPLAALLFVKRRKGTRARFYLSLRSHENEESGTEKREPRFPKDGGPDED